jgi:hypothetical protein
MAVRIASLGGTDDPDHRSIGRRRSHGAGWWWRGGPAGHRPGLVHRLPGAHRPRARRSKALSAGASGRNRSGSCRAHRARVPRAWPASLRSAAAARNVRPRAETGRQRGSRARTTCPTVPTPHCAKPGRVSRPRERHRHLSACSAASRRASRNWPSWPRDRTAVSPGGPTSTTLFWSTSTVRHRSRLMTSPQLTCHT